MDVFGRMLEALVITLREGIEAALVIAIVIAYLGRTGRAHLSRVVYGGVAAAVAASLAAAVLVRSLGVDPENELWEGSLMLGAAGLVLSLVVWMRRAGRHMRSQVEARLDGVVAGDRRSTAKVGLFAFTFVMVFREGVETVLFLGALSGAIGANPLYNALGGGLGLGLAALFGVLLVQGSVTIDLRRFFRVTEAVLLLLVAKLAANGLHEFFEVGLLPSNEAVLAIVGFLTRDTMSLIVMIVLIGLPAAVLVGEAWRQHPAAAADGETLADARRRRAEHRAARMWSASAGLAGLALSVLLALSGVAAARGFDPAPVRLALSRPVLTIPLAELGEPPLKKYEVAIDGVTVRFLVVRAPNGHVAIALDACAICPLKGYHMMGNQLVCGNCSAPITPDTIGVMGGCNPIPLDAEVSGGTVIVRADALAAARARFGHRG